LTIDNFQLQINKQKGFVCQFAIVNLQCLLVTVHQRLI
jgi:hypothetical protein